MQVPGGETTVAEGGIARERTGETKKGYRERGRGREREWEGCRREYGMRKRRDGGRVMGRKSERSREKAREWHRRQG